MNAHRIVMAAAGALVATTLAALSLGGCSSSDPPPEKGGSVQTPAPGLGTLDGCDGTVQEYIDSSGVPIVCVYPDPDPDPEPPCASLPGGCFPDPEPPDPGGDPGGGGDSGGGGDPGGGTLPDPTEGGCSQTFINAAKEDCRGPSGVCARFMCGASSGIHSCTDNGNGTNTYVCACACGPISRVGDTF